MSRMTLGLDLGPNSIGWAIIEENEAGDPRSLEAMGVRAFQEMVDRESKTPKNHERRKARLARRQRARRKRRREKLRNQLVRGGLLPGDAGALRKLFHEADPYEIRKRGLDEELTPCELGRAIFHLNQRRGFKSNRKVLDSGEKKKEDGVVLQEIAGLKKEMAAAGSRTLGEFLAAISREGRKRSRYTERKMYEEEFDLLWRKQAARRPRLLSDELRDNIREALFSQRPLKLQKNLVGKCAFEPYKKRCPLYRPEAQWFRALLDVNNLEVRDPETGEDRSLREDEREVIKKRLREQKTLSWNAVRRALRLHDGEIFNLEQDERKELPGARTLLDVRKILGKEAWEAMPEKKRNKFLEDLFSIHKEETLKKRLKEYWGIQSQIEGLLKLKFESKHAKLSLRAIRKITPHLERGLKYAAACIAAGYKHEYQKEIEAGDLLLRAPNIRNPIVQKAINEVRKVVNAIIREYGKPDRIRVELARDMKRSKEHREEERKKNAKNRKLNLRAKEKIEAQGLPYNHGNRIRYRLWEDQKGVCPYTGESIGMSQIFSEAVHVDHILPYSRTLDDSYMNKALCKASANQEKKNATPYEAWGQKDPERFDKIRQRVFSMKDMPYRKRRRFEQKKIDLDGFIERQLNDTRYISREVSNYLKQLGVRVDVTRGQVTHDLRHFWELNEILAADSSLKNGSVMEKNRADHRHHAIDALVVALTTRKIFQRLARFYGVRTLPEKQRFPWPGFKDEVRRKVKGIVVSHQPLRKISGAFHEETAYGRIKHKGGPAFVRRVPLESLTAPQVKKIVDRRIRELVRERMEAHGNKARDAFANKPLWLEHSRKGAGRTPIKTVRVAENFNPDGLFHVRRQGEEEPFKYYAYGNNHHVEIIENAKTGRRKGVVVTAMEAARRARRERTPIVRRDHGPEWKFVMSLSINDLVKLDEPVNGCSLYRVQKLSAIGSGQITLRAHTAASLDDNATRLLASPNTLRGRKVSVDPLGKLETAHD